MPSCHFTDEETGDYDRLFTKSTLEQSNLATALTVESSKVMTLNY